MNLTKLSTTMASHLFSSSSLIKTLPRPHSPSSSSFRSLHFSAHGKQHRSFTSVVTGSSFPRPSPISHDQRLRNLCVASSSSMSENGLPDSPTPFQGAESFFRSVLSSMETVYMKRNPTAQAILELVHDPDQICYDHIAFRTFGINGYGIDSVAKFFLDYGYTAKDELRFPAKKLRALWFSPPGEFSSGNGNSGSHGPLPRVFISELLVNEMTPPTQEIIRKYVGISGNGHNHAILSSALGNLTWGKPLYSEFEQLARESEYAAWTLVNGYALNHVTISVHRLKSQLGNIESFNKFIAERGFHLNSEGGVLKVSPDGLLLQSSTVADSFRFEFSDGVTESVPCSYIEFAERLVLPEFKHLPETEIEEVHRRDGFEVGNADKIFESTSKEQLTRRTA